MRWSDPKEIKPDNKWFAPLVNGSIDFINKAKTKEGSELKAIKDGLDNYTIISFWESEYL